MTRYAYNWLFFGVYLCNAYLLFFHYDSLAWAYQQWPEYMENRIDGQYKDVSLVKQAQQAYRNKQLEQAEFYANAAIQYDTYSSKAYLILAKIHRLQGHHKLAITYLDSLIKFDPYQVNAYILLSKSHQYLGHNELADKTLLNGISFFKNTSHINQTKTDNSVKSRYNRKAQRYQDKLNNSLAKLNSIWQQNQLL